MRRVEHFENAKKVVAEKKANLQMVAQAEEISQKWIRIPCGWLSDFKIHDDPKTKNYVGGS